MRKSQSSVNPFRAGFDARLANRSIVSNPYPKDSADREEWNAGFKKACENLDGPKREMEVIREGPVTVVEESFLPDPSAADVTGGVAWPKKQS